jgi:pimeloyl-ACP methyl ester carboxylesterase
MRFVNQITAYVFVSILVVGGCSKGDSSSSPPTTVNRPPVDFVAGPCPETPHPNKWLANARCGSITVPLDRSKADGPTIKLTVAIVPSETQPPTKKPIVVLDGGPGQDAVADEGIVPDGVGLNHDRDLILMGQRGDITSSVNLTCPEIDKFIQRRLGLVYDAQSTGDAYVQAVKECRARLTPTADFAAMNSIESSYDLIDLRKALKIDKWDVFSHSYGTELALVYMRYDAAGINAIAFDGVTPPSVGGQGWTWATAKQTLDNMTAACDQQPACKERYPDLKATFIRLVQQTEEKPITTTVGDTQVVIDGGKLIAWFAPVATHLPADFPTAIYELDQGNPELIAKQMVMAWGSAGAGPPVFSWGLTLSIWCREWIPFETREDALAKATEAFPMFPDSVKAQAPQLPFLREACAAWDVPKGPDSIRDITKSDLPALVLSGSFDGQTGAIWGDYIAKNLSDAVVVVVPGAAHGVAAEPCGASIVASFFNDPKMVDTSCAKEPPPPYNIPAQ